jgi:Protein phosphatase 2C
VQISHATRSSPGRANEDYAAAGSGWAMVLDGATPARGVASGCLHDVRWLVRGLAAALARRLTLAEPGPLAALLAAAIGEVRETHAGSCDLGNPDSPSSTVSVVRVHGSRVDYLVLCDSPVVFLRRDGQVRPITDERLARLPGGPPYRVDVVRAHRNQPGGFWVASTDPAAADQAVCGSVSLESVTDVALCTDGVARLVDWYGYSWAEVFARLDEVGPAGVIDLVRAEERADPRPRAKPHDDATLAHLRL